MLNFLAFPKKELGRIQQLSHAFVGMIASYDYDRFSGKAHRLTLKAIRKYELYINVHSEVEPIFSVITQLLPFSLFPCFYLLFDFNIFSLSFFYFCFLFFVFFCFFGPRRRKTIKQVLHEMKTNQYQTLSLAFLYVEARS